MTATIYPVLHYADLEKGVAFVADVFGITEHMAHRDPDGRLAYVELELDGCIFGVGPTTEGSVFHLGPTAVYMTIADPDAMHARAKEAGAEIVMGLVDQDYGSREFAARDFEGNVWCFGTYRPGA